MPETRMKVRWPDGGEAAYYSPSLVIEGRLPAGSEHTVASFVALATEALSVASDRVHARFGFHCSRARASSEAVRDRAAGFEPEARVDVLGFERITA